MRHEQLALRETFDVVEPAHLRGQTATAVATPAVPDMPIALGRMIVGIYVALIGVFFATMASGREATFMIVVSGLYVCMFFAIPRILLHFENDPSRRPSLSRFMSEGIVTGTGHMTGGSALAQIFIVPVGLTLGLFAMGVTALLFI